MALTQQQISGLNALAGKKNLTATDLANLNYAKSQGYTLPSTSLTAPVVPQGAVPINGAQYGTKELQQANFTNIQPLGNTLYGIPKVPTSLSQEQLNTPTITPTSTLPTSYDPNTFVSSSKAYFDQVMNDYTTSQQEAAKLNEQKLNERTTISKLMETIGKKGTDYQSQLDSLGVTQSTNQLQDLNKQIAAATAAFNKQVVGAESQTADITTGVVGGQVNMIRRQQAAEVGALTSVAQAVQGNIELAYQTAEKSINLKYEPLENQLKQELQQLDFIYQDLSSAEKKQADSRATLLNERLRLIEEQKTEENNVNNIALEAAKNGADMNTINKIRNSKTVGEAITAAGNSLSAGTDGAPKKIGTDENGNDLFYDPTTGTVKTAAQITPTSSDGSAYFTDANGTKWNVGGWAANDASKVASMQQTANMIGKVDESNIEQKVAQFTPGITADMVKKASALTGVSWEAIMTQVVQESTGGTSNVAVKNNNFGGLTFNNQEWIKQFGGTKGTARPASEGGNYIKFPTKQDGLNALAALQASYGIVNEAPQKNETNQNIIQWGNELASTGKMPTGVPANFVGRVAQYANTVPKRDGLLVSTANGLPLDITPAQKDGLAAIYDLTKQIAEAKTLFKTLQGSMQTGLGSFVGSIAPTEERQKYDSLRKNIWDLIARARTGAVIGEEEAKLYQSLVPSTHNKTFGIGQDGLTKLDSLMNLISGGLETKLQAFGGDFIGREKTVGGKTLVRVYENGQLGWKDK